MIEAVAWGRTEAAEFLIKKKADLNKANKKGNTALMRAALNNNIEIVKILIKKKADLNRTNRDGNTALKLAEREGRAEIVRLLRDAGARR